MTTSQIEQQALNLVDGQSNYISDTSIYYDDLPAQLQHYTLNRLTFDGTYKLTGVADTVVFQFAIISETGSTTAGRAIWITLPSGLLPLNIIRSEIGNIVTFDYPGENKSLYMKRLGEWKLVSPIQSNMIWLSTPLHEITELAIVDGTIDTGKILIRREFNENTVA